MGILKRWVFNQIAFMLALGTSGVVLPAMIQVVNASSELGSLDCLMEPNTTIELSSPVQGVVEHMHVDRGDRVSSGQLLVSLNSDMEKARLDLAKARAEFGVRTQNRNSDIETLISGHEKDEVETDTRLAILERDEAQAALEQKRIKSPIEGMVIDRRREEGEYVSSEPILTIVNIDPIYIEVIAPVEYFGRVKKDLKALIIPEDPIGGSFEAKVKTIDQVVDPGSGTFRIRLILKNPGRKIPTGLRCKVDFGDV